MKSLLSVGGGGCKCFVECGILAEIERRSGKTILDLFDMAAGTSGGGIIIESIGAGHSAQETMDFFRWKYTFKRDGMTPLVRMGLREALTPQIELKAPFRWGGREIAKEDRPERITDLVGVEVVLASDYAAGEDV